MAGNRVYKEPEEGLTHCYLCRSCEWWNGVKCTLKYVTGVFEDDCLCYDEKEGGIYDE